jgi:hypothetical protein
MTSSTPIRRPVISDGAVTGGPFLHGPAPMAVDYLLTVLLPWLDRDEVAASAPRLAVLADALASAGPLSPVLARHQ